MRTCTITFFYTKELGIKGPSWLGTVPTFDMARGVSFDYMHCCLLNLCRLLLRLWFKSTYHKQPWYIGRQVKNVDKRLCSIQPPDEIQRTPRSIESTVKYWKGMLINIFYAVKMHNLVAIAIKHCTFIHAAHELQAWLLHYSPAVLYEILPEDYYQHHLLLVEGVYLLLQDSIKEEHLEKSARLLQHYCYLLSPLYGMYQHIQHGCKISAMYVVMSCTCTCR